MLAFLLFFVQVDSLKWVDDLAVQAVQGAPTAKQQKAIQERFLKIEKTRLNAAKRGPITGKSVVSDTGFTFASKASKDEAIRQFQQNIAMMEAQIKSPSPRGFPELPLRQPMLDDAGVVWGSRLKIIQISTPTEALVEIQLVEYSGRADIPPTVSPFIFKLTHDTSKWNDGLFLDGTFDKPIIFHKTTQYVTVQGAAKTVLLARLWSKEEMDRFTKTVRQLAAKKK